MIMLFMSNMSVHTIKTYPSYGHPLVPFHLDKGGSTVCSKFLNWRFMKSMLASFPFSNGLGASLPLSRVKNLVIGNGRT